MASVVLITLFCCLSDDAADRDVSCGVGAAFLLLERLGAARPLNEIEAASPVSPNEPMSLADLEQMFQRLGFSATGYRMPLERLDRPVIAFRPHPHGKVGHFIVVEPIGKGSGVGYQKLGVGAELAPLNAQLSSGPQPRRAGTQKPSTLNPQPSSDSQLFLVIDPLGMPTKVSGGQLRQVWDGRVLVVHSADGTGTASALAWRGIAAMLLLVAATALAGSVAWLGWRRLRWNRIGRPDACPAEMLSHD